MSSMMTSAKIALAGLLLLTAGGCDGAPPDADRDRPAGARAFPRPDRPVSPIRGNQFATEKERDAAGEATEIMDRAGVKPGMSVADIGAGNGYYTVNLAARVGPTGRVLAQDIDPRAIRMLGERIAREELDNVSIITGMADDPRLPPASFDRIFLVHMYHEVTEPYAFLWNMRGALKADGQIIVVESDRPTDRHGIPPELLACEFKKLGLKATEYIERPELGGYFARFQVMAKRPEPADIKPCRTRVKVSDAHPCSCESRSPVRIDSLQTAALRVRPGAR